MPHIQQLDPHVADLIAAGEVVERPASVAKELLENAFDAGAAAVTLELKDGGMTYLRVSDDGCGIAPAELPTAFLRHATSKLREAGDLAAIGTLGFRGEALAAISAVSRLDIFTRQKGAASGAALHLEGGVPGEVSEAGCPEGTSIIVRDLFYNTPARLKFMKRDSAEATAIAGIVSHLALSHPNISFRLLRDGQETLHTPGDGALLSAIYAALGREFALSLLEISGRDGALAAEGFVTRPLSGRGTRGMQTFFVNGRLVKSQLLTAALEEAYANRLMKGKFPGCVLCVTVPFDMVDVNVHPAKTIVKFVSDKQIFDLVYHTVSDALDRAAMPPERTKPPEAAPRKEPDGYFQTMTAAQFRASRLGAANARDALSAVSELGGRVRVSDVARQESFASHAAAAPVVYTPWASGSALRENRSGKAPEESLASPAGAGAVQTGASESYDTAFTESYPTLSDGPEADDSARAETAETPAHRDAEPAEAALSGETAQNAMAEPEQSDMLRDAPLPWRIAGEVLNTYIVCEDTEGTVWLIDKHAAHERINFDRLKAQKEPVMSQRLLTPLVAQLAPEEYAALSERFELLREFGFDCEDFGGGAVLINAVPSDIDEGEAAAALEELAGKLLQGGNADPGAARDALLATLACKAAIKGGWKSDERELRTLVDRVQSGEIAYCPHGRPVKASLARRELEKMFKRIV